MTNIHAYEVIAWIALMIGITGTISAVIVEWATNRRKYIKLIHQILSIIANAAIRQHKAQKIVPQCSMYTSKGKLVRRATTNKGWTG